MFSVLGTLSFTSALASVFAATVGGFDDGGSTLVSAMMVSREATYTLHSISLAPFLDVPR